MKQIKLTPLIFGLLLFSCNQAETSSEGQNQTNPPQDNIKCSREEPYTESELKEADTLKVPTGQVRNIKQARNGDILISSFLGVFRYDGTSFTNLTSKISSPRFSSFWDVLEDRIGNLWFATRDSGVYLLPSGQTNFQHFTTKQRLASNYGATHLYEDKAGNIWFGGGRYDCDSGLPRRYFPACNKYAGRWRQPTYCDGVRNWN